MENIDRDIKDAIDRGYSIYAQDTTVSEQGKVESKNYSSDAQFKGVINIKELITKPWKLLAQRGNYFLFVFGEQYSPGVMGMVYNLIGDELLFHRNIDSVLISQEWAAPRKEFMEKSDALLEKVRSAKSMKVAGASL